MTKDFLIIDADGNSVIDAMAEHFTAKVKPIYGNNFFKVELETADDYFNCGVYNDKHTAQAELDRMYKTLKKFKRGECGNIDAFRFKDSDVSAIELLTLVEVCNELDRAKKLRGARMSAVDDCICEIEDFLDKLRITNLQKGGV